MTSQIEVLQHQTTALNVGGYGVRSKAPDIFIDESGTIATRINEDGSRAVIWSMLYPKDSITTFRFKIVKSKYEDGDSIYFGVVNNNFSNLS